MVMLGKMEDDVGEAPGAGALGAGVTAGALTSGTGPAVAPARRRVAAAKMRFFIVQRLDLMDTWFLKRLCGDLLMRISCLAQQQMEQGISRAIYIVDEDCTTSRQSSVDTRTCVQCDVALSSPGMSARSHTLQTSS